MSVRKENLELAISWTGTLKMPPRACSEIGKAERQIMRGGLRGVEFEFMKFFYQCYNFDVLWYRRRSFQTQPIPKGPT